MKEVKYELDLYLVLKKKKTVWLEIAYLTNTQKSQGIIR